jgi:GntR family transcriptional regulator / MocR family aminotransferase
MWYPATSTFLNIEESNLDLQISIVGRDRITRQIYNEVRSAITGGRLRKGQRLPATRELAMQLGVSRKTVTTAYDLLIADGLVAGRAGSGTFVADVLTQRRLEGAMTSTRIVLSHFWQRPPSLPVFAREACPYDFGLGVPDVSRFPWAVWRSVLNSRLRLLPKSAQAYGQATGYPPLREAISKYVGFSRAVACTPEHLIVTNGAQQAFALIADVLLRPGDIVAMESPGYPMARWLFRSHGTKVVDVPVDDEGLMVDRLPSKTRIIYTTPSHQFPLGLVMSYRRKSALLEWASRHGAAIIEDDYDSEFRFDGRPLESLQSMDRNGVVIYVGTFSKILFPDVRLGFVVSPRPLRTALAAAKQMLDWHASVLMQMCVCAFMTEGHLARHVRRMRRLYAERRARLITEIDRTLSEWVTLIPSPTGLHIGAHLKRGLPAETISEATMAAGIRVRLIPGAITFGYGAIDTDSIHQGLAKLRAVFLKAERQDG